MGGLLNVFNKDQPHQVNFFLDFQNVTLPNGEDLETYNSIRDVLNRSPEFLQMMDNYVGCSDLVQKAIGEPTEQNEKAVFEVLLPSVVNLQMIYQYSLEIMDVARNLLTTLCMSGNLENQVALAKLLCDLFNFVLQFDDKKMLNPHINNNFSYYRRSAAKLRSNGVKTQLPDDVANKMSLFYAYPTPLMNMLSTQLVFEGGVSKDEIIGGLASLANVCLDMVEKERFNDRDLNIFCLRAMTSAIVLIDHLSEDGVFCRRSPVNIKQAIIILKNKVDELQTVGLVNALKYTTRHLNDEDTPDVILELINN